MSQSIDISKLSRESKLALAKALNQRKLYKDKNKLALWKPWVCRHDGIHDSQKAAFMSKARRRVVIGGNRTGKTYLGATDVCHFLLGSHPYRECRINPVVRIAAESWDKIANPIQTYMFSLIPSDQLSRTKKNSQGYICYIELKNGATAYFMSYNQDPEEFESWSADMLWCDEPPPYVLWEGMRRGLIDRRGEELYTATLLKEPWIYDKFCEPALEGRLPNTEVFYLKTTCNPHISEEELEDLKKDYDDDDIAATRIDGLPRHMHGVIYKQFNRNLHVIPSFKWDHDWPVYMCIDPHLKKPHAVTWIGVDKNDTLYILNELKFSGTIKELAHKILEIEGINNYNVVDRIVDTSINAADKKPQLRVLDEAGLRCRFPSKKNELLSGIERVKEKLTPEITNEGTKVPGLFVFDTCTGHVSEFMHYRWKEEKKGTVIKQEPIKINDDYMDNVRYIISIRPSFHYIKEPISYIHGATYYERTKETGKVPFYK